MKKMLKIIVAVILTMSLLSGTVLACEEMYSYSCSASVVVATGGNSYIRIAPDLNAKIVGCLDQGNVADYYGCSEYDWRGVRWDFVNYYGTTGWISSRYTTLY